MGIFEIIVILALALIVVGPEGLPDLLKTAGKVLRELRAAGNTVMREITEVTDEPRRIIRDFNPLEPNSGTGTLEHRASESTAQDAQLNATSVSVEPSETEIGTNHSDSNSNHKPEEPPQQH